MSFETPNRHRTLPALPDARRLLVGIARLAPLLVIINASAAELSGQIVSIADGDTLTMLVERKQVKVRLADIDAPERKQRYGTRSRHSLAELCHKKGATVVNREKDRYGRTVGYVICAGVDANAEQVRRGMAWVFDRYAERGSPLYALQAEAKNAQRGLWGDSNAVAPWEWRRWSADQRKATTILPRPKIKQQMMRDPNASPSG